MSTESRFARRHPATADLGPTIAEWKFHKEEIANLYLRKSYTSHDLMRYFRDRYHFEATQKHWNTTLSKWEMRRNMMHKDAARILKLYQDAEAQALSREVFFNGDLKTRADISTYARESVMVDSEAELLDFVEDGPLPSPITYVDTPQPQPQSSGMYMHHTISRDLSGTKDQVTSKLLAALGERSSRTTDLSILAERSTRKTDLSILSERSSRRADLSVLISKSEESTRTTQRLPFRQ